METYIFGAVIIACVIFILACIVRKRPDLVVDFGLRAALGTAGTYLLDFLLRSKGYEINVGINPATIITNGFLGLPGFIMLYGLSIYYTFSK